MRENNFTVASMHGEMVQKERDAIMQEFRQGARYVKRLPTDVAVIAIHSFCLETCSRVLITTDVWARGIVSIHVARAKFGLVALKLTPIE